jgi:hypothetical protein
MHEIMRKIFFNHISAVAQANNEIIEAIMRINLHDMPKYRLASDFNHRLGYCLGFLANPGSPASC